jgi:isocitrate dehydrogenase (NAD+)
VLRSGNLLLDYIGQHAVAGRIESAIRRTLQAGQGLTRDLGGTGNTSTLTQAIIANLAS